MKITQSQVEQVLQGMTLPGQGEDLISSGAVTNIQVFGDQIDIDLKLNNPSLQARKKLEVEILKNIHEQIHQKAKVNTKVIVEKGPETLRYQRQPHSWN